MVLRLRVVLVGEVVEDVLVRSRCVALGVVIARGGSCEMLCFHRVFVVTRIAQLGGMDLAGAGDIELVVLGRELCYDKGNY